MEMQAALHSGMSGQSSGQQSLCMAIAGAGSTLEMDARLVCARTAPTNRATRKRRVLSNMQRSMLEFSKISNTRFAEAEILIVSTFQAQIA
ncbi:hypothetical protein [uncultured Sulfitobacter sp.]|uniref:hypothetical protein n=1 Tax=uncultured Sulfitobacter sp. TaxID=191468 RepID=UPI00261AFE7A|nr:hypothetical protein [uncultured Sulfitobacter sp.]